MRSFIAIFLIALVNLSTGQFNPHWESNRNSIVQLFEWNFPDIGQECERFLGPFGFAGVQISPNQDNKIVPGRPWWERYQPVSINMVSRSGSEKTFEQMSEKCNRAGVRVYVDVVMNHMAFGNEWIFGVGGGQANPLMFDFPFVPFNETDFNQPQCEIDPCYCVAENIRNCKLLGMPDLNLTRQHVRDKMVIMLNRYLYLGAAGFHIDASKHMWPSDLEAIYARLNNLNTDYGFPPNARPFIMHEIVDFGGEAVSKFEYHHLGTVTEFNFANEMGRAFQGTTQMRYLRTLGESWHYFSPSNRALTFIDSADSQRDSNPNFLNHKTRREYVMATAFHLAWTYGIPRIMSSFAFENNDDGPPANFNEVITSPIILANNTCGGGWVCEHRWHQIRQMVEFRNQVAGAVVRNWWDNGGNQIAFSRGDRGFIAFNGENNQMRVWLSTGLAGGTYCDIITGEKSQGECTGRSLIVHNDGRAEIILQANAADGVFAIHIGSRL